MKNYLQIYVFPVTKLLQNPFFCIKCNVSKEPKRVVCAFCNSWHMVPSAFFGNCSAIPMVLLESFCGIFTTTDPVDLMLAGRPFDERVV